MIHAICFLADCETGDYQEIGCCDKGHMKINYVTIKESWDEFCNISYIHQKSTIKLSCVSSKILSCKAKFKLIKKPKQLKFKVSHPILILKFHLSSAQNEPKVTASNCTEGIREVSHFYTLLAENGTRIPKVYSRQFQCNNTGMCYFISKTDEVWIRNLK